MSLLNLPTSSLSPPLKRSRESEILFNTSSKCAEIFVTTNADKWTFFCVHCEKATSDIGAFICHIRLEHLNGSHIQLGENDQSTKLSTNNNTSEASGESKEIVEAKNSNQDGQQPTQSDAGIVNEEKENLQSNTSKDHNISDAALLRQAPESSIVKKEVIVNEELAKTSDITLLQQPQTEGLQPSASKVPKISDVTSLRQPSACKETDNLQNKDNSSTMSQQLENNLEFFAITALGHDLEQHNQKEIVQVVYINDEGHKTATKQEQEQSDEDNNENNNETIRHTDDNAAMSSYTPSDEEHHEDEDVNTKLKCSYCQKVFENMQTLYAHTAQEHERNFRLKLPYKCSKCNKDFKYKGSLEKHALTKHKGLIMQCPVCPEKRTKWCFLAHVRTHESDTCFPCQVCGKIFASNRERMKHWKIHAAEKPYVCNVCLQRFRKQQYLTGHMKIHPRYQCSSCSILFTSRKSQKPPHICEKCNEMPPEKMVVELDPAVMEENSDNSEVITDMDHLNANSSACLNDDDTISINDDEDSDIEFIDESYADNIPSVSSSNTGQTPKDDANNSSSSLYKCQYCNREFISERRLICHTSKMHDKHDSLLSRFLCRYCNRSFQTRSGLALHHKTHDKSNQFHCPICPLTEFRESSFITHVLMHESPSCFPCQVCAKVFSSNTERLQHWRIHIEERPHGCNHCYRRFYQKNVLKNHMKSHGLYYCHLCQNNFQSDRTIQPPYICGECEKLPHVDENPVKRRSTSKSNRKAIDSEGE